MTSQEERLAELESRLEFQDETIATLNDEIVLHHERIADLEKKMERLAENLRGQAETDASPEPPPPHY